MVVDTALESPASALPNAVLMTTKESGNGEWLACKSALESAGISCGPLDLGPHLRARLLRVAASLRLHRRAARPGTLLHVVGTSLVAL